MTLWFASGNAHKKAELAAILSAHGCAREIRVPADAGLDFNPDETEDSFHGNALLKARALYGLLRGNPGLFRDGDPIVADDSGICVDALGGRPGIYSAMYAGPPGREVSGKLEPHDRNRLLLEDLGDSPMRKARFACAMALVFSPDRFFVFQETFEGEIVKSAGLARGTGGFGYDPILLVPGLGRTVAELSDDEKNRISHRGKAAKHLAAMLNAL
ncbi:MAG: non-canonical purine NTP pyrophosphatase [Treponema sp.]|nr:non-canonical purine NTP pyrophosphatase [Treponema sp.]